MIEVVVTLVGVMLAAAVMAIGLGCLIANSGGLRVNTREEKGGLVSDLNPILAQVGLPLQFLAASAAYIGGGAR